jgi:hypothetical protein
MACRTVQVRVCSVCSVQSRIEHRHCSRVAEPNKPPVLFVFSLNRTSNGSKKFCSVCVYLECSEEYNEHLQDVELSVIFELLINQCSQLLVIGRYWATVARYHTLRNRGRYAIQSIKSPAAMLSLKQSQIAASLSKYEL